MPDEIQETPEQKYARLYQQQPPQSTTVTTEAPLAAPPAAVIPPEFTSLLQEMRQEIADLKGHVTKPAAPQQPIDPDAWVEKIRQGDYAGARQLLVEETKRGLQAEFQTVLTNANAQAQAQIDTNLYRNQVRAANPDLLEFEPYLEAPIQQHIDAAHKAGKIRNTADYVKEYKSALDAEVAKIRNLSLKFRASGKEEATIRKQDVISSSTLNPQQVTSLTAPQEGQEAQVETTEDYFARRRADEARRRGLA